MPVTNQYAADASVKAVSASATPRSHGGESAGGASAQAQRLRFVDARRATTRGERQLLAQVEPRRQLAHRRLPRLDDVRGAAAAVSQPASVSSPARVRASESSSNSEPRPKRSRSSRVGVAIGRGSCSPVRPLPIQRSSMRREAVFVEVDQPGRRGAGANHESWRTASTTKTTTGATQQPRAPAGLPDGVAEHERRRQT